jgi:hypothetical protein
MPAIPRCKDGKRHGRKSAANGRVTSCYNSVFVVESFLSNPRGHPLPLPSRSDTALEVLALRQQVAVLKRKRPRPCLNGLDRFFWTTLRRVWSRWTDVLAIVNCRRMAPHWFPSLLALALSIKGKAAEDHRGDLCSDPALGARESGVGRTEDPW